MTMKGRHHTEETKRKLREIAILRNWVGNRNPNWKRGVLMLGGYKYILSPNHPNKTKTGYVVEHRLVMEKHLGRLLKKKEVVHHKDENKLNNIIENLVLYESIGKHTSNEHMKKDELGRFC